MTLLAVSLLALAEMTVYVYKKDGTKVPYVASTVDSIGFVNLFTITFDANGGDGSMDVVRVKDGETIILPDNFFTKGSSTFIGWNTAADGAGTAYADKASVTLIANQTLYAQWEASKDTGIADGHEWVDLGLPSGTKWATMNVGADSPEDYGDYFAWGETVPKANYSWSTYKWCKGSSTTQTKYCTSSSDGTVDNKTVLDLADDAANANWGGDWRMPTKTEQDELRTECTWIWVQKNGVNGYTVIGPNGNSIFLPAAGYRCDFDLSNAGSYGDYWSSSLYTYYSFYAYGLSSYSDGVFWNYYDYRSRGQSVRPVLRVELP